MKYTRKEKEHGFENSGFVLTNDSNHDLSSHVTVYGYAI
jgi:hypothetical protein